MTVITDTWRQLVQRRLLPVAVLLLAALVAVPLLLAKDPEPAPLPTSLPAAGKESPATAALSTQPIVTLVEDGAPARRRRVLGARKNPFEPAPAPQAPRAARAQSDAGQPANSGPSTVGAADDGSGGSSGGSAPSTPTSPGGTPPQSTPPAATQPNPAPKPEYELYSLTVRFGDSSADQLEKMNLPRLKALGSNVDPILVYLGLAGDGKTAVFLVDAAVEVQGDGICHPNPANCETIHLRVGDTELFDVKDEAGTVTAQYQMDLLEINTRTTASAAKAKAARTRASKAGREVLRAHQAEAGPLRYRYDARSGTLRKLDKKAFKAAVARVAKAATGSFEVSH